MNYMIITDDRLLTTSETTLIKARAKALAREDRELMAALIRVRREAGLSQKRCG